METEKPKRKPWVVLLLCGIPLWLLVSGGFGIWGYFRAQKAEQKKESARFATVVSASSLADDFRKLTVIIGPRSPGIEDGKGLTRAASWIEGLLGPSNTGYKVQAEQVSEAGGWPILRIDLQGSEDTAAPLWILSPYDAPADAEGLADASSAVVATIAAAQAIAGEKPWRPVRFVFLPSGGNKAIENAALKMIRGEAAPYAVLCIGPMRKGELLSVAATDSHPARVSLGALGSSGAAAPVDATWVSSLSQADLPVGFIGSKPQLQEGSQMPEPELMAASTGRLAELIRRLIARK